MINIVNIWYKIDGFGRVEKTNLYGLEENSYFFLGNQNHNELKVLIKKVYLDRILLQFDENCGLILPNENNEIEIKIGEEVVLETEITPSQFYHIKLVDISEAKRMYFR